MPSFYKRIQGNTGQNHDNKTFNFKGQLPHPSGKAKDNRYAEGEKGEGGEMSERQQTINGIEGRLWWSDSQSTRTGAGCFTTQEWSASKQINSHRSIRVTIRFDDECGNGHHSFSVTGEIRDTKTGDRRDNYIESCGCIHEDIAKHFPELAHLIKWHLFDTSGPMHYIGNTTFHAGNRDCWGKLKGEPKQWETAIQFGDNPLKHAPGSSSRHQFITFLKGAEPYDFEVVAIEHENRPGESYKFTPKYTFGGFGEEWHDCPFDTEERALDFLYALQHCGPQFVEIVTAWGEGKERDLAAARNCAVWPEATDEQLCLPKDELTALLEARLPALVAAFRADVEACGFLWEREAVPA